MQNVYEHRFVLCPMRYALLICEPTSKRIKGQKVETFAMVDAVVGYNGQQLWYFAVKWWWISSACLRIKWNFDIWATGRCCVHHHKHGRDLSFSCNRTLNIFQFMEEKKKIALRFFRNKICQTHFNGFWAGIRNGFSTSIENGNFLKHAANEQWFISFWQFDWANPFPFRHTKAPCSAFSRVRLPLDSHLRILFISRVVRVLKIDHNVPFILIERVETINTQWKPENLMYFSVYESTNTNECCVSWKLNAINLRFVCDLVPVWYCYAVHKIRSSLHLLYSFQNYPAITKRSDGCSALRFNSSVLSAVESRLSVLCAHNENEEIKRDEQIFTERRKWWWSRKHTTAKCKKKKNREKK